MTLFFLSTTPSHTGCCAGRQLHVSYTFAPLRYAWQSAHEYFQDGPLAPISSLIMHYMRLWDPALPSVDHFAAVSSWTADCVWRAYGSEAEIIFPPVDTGVSAPPGRAIPTTLPFRVS